jgi:hypothetical protein
MRLKKIPNLPNIPDTEQTPTVRELLEVCTIMQEQLALQKELIQCQRDEIARLKGEKPKPDIKPSKLENSTRSDSDEDDKNKNDSKKRPGSRKKKKTRKLKIHKMVNCTPDNLPEGSRFKGYNDFFVQDLKIEPYNVHYRQERRQTPSGDNIVGKLPDNISQGHFGNTLVGYILYQYHHSHVTQPLILEQLQEIGIDISAGQINRFITEGNDLFHAEKEDILDVALEVSDYVNVDDTGARHQGRNGYCTHIGNKIFAWFESTQSKSRINFLTLLQGKHPGYLLNQNAFDYMEAHNLPQKTRQTLALFQANSIKDKQAWEEALECLGITSKQHIRIATEGVMIAALLESGINKNLVIISDDAGQFNILIHALCWVHAERAINKLVGYTDQQRRDLELIQDQLWIFYAGLKAYKKDPTPQKKIELEADFDKLFSTKTCYTSLNNVLKRIYANKAELLLVLERPEIPLHNNLSESDIREYVKKRKISGSTRSEKGRRSRDTFTSLKKTARKLNISFWEYLLDRLSGRKKIPPLSACIYQHARAPS